MSDVDAARDVYSDPARWGERFDTLRDLLHDDPALCHGLPHPLDDEGHQRSDECDRLAAAIRAEAGTLDVAVSADVDAARENVLQGWALGVVEAEPIVDALIAAIRIETRAAALRERACDIKQRHWHEWENLKATGRIAIGEALGAWTSDD